MIFEKVESKGLAHYSYFVADGTEAFVIDPTRDVKRYLDLAKKHGVKIKHIFETHRNEDYTVGSIELAEKTASQINISSYEDLAYTYGTKISEEDEFTFGNLRLKPLHTPGHTLGHLSYILYENSRPEPYMVFTGDCLFMGDLGRTDFYGEENLEKMTGLLYDSVFSKLFDLGDDVIVMPAHGAGSACGQTMEDRPYTTIGYERNHNPKLQVGSKEDFIKSFGTMRIKPRYFEKMEVYNVKGAPYLGEYAYLQALSYPDISDEDILIDLRAPEAFVASHIPGSIYIGPGNLASLLGVLVDTEESIVFIAENNDMEVLNEAYWDAKRTGFENIRGYLKDGVRAYNSLGMSSDSLEAISGANYKNIENKTSLDIRNVEYLSEIGRQDGLVKLPIQILYKDHQILDKDETIYVLCATGNRATSASSYLKNLGYKPVVVLGGLKALGN